MRQPPISVLETPLFERQAAKIWSAAELTALVDFLARNPEAGDVIPGAGGVRKLRWGRTGIGKRGAARALYYHMDAPLYLLFAYAKSRQEDMNPDEKRAMSALVAVIRNEHPFRRTER